MALPLILDSLCGKWATGFYASCHIWTHIYNIACVCNVDECGHRKKSRSVHIVLLSALASGGRVQLRVLVPSTHQAHCHFSAVELAVPSTWHAAPPHRHMLTPCVYSNVIFGSSLVSINKNCTCCSASCPPSFCLSFTLSTYYYPSYCFTWLCF